MGDGDVPGARASPTRRLTQPRPGHADLAGMQKYGFDDARDVLERASARETAARVAAGALAKALLAQIGVAVVSHVVQIGSAEARAGLRPLPGDLARVDESPVRCFDPSAEAEMIAEIAAAARRATRSAAPSRSPPTASPWAWAATSTGTASSTASSPMGS